MTCWLSPRSPSVESSRDEAFSRRRSGARVVAQGDEVGPRELRVGGERDRDLGPLVVERLDAGVRHRQRREHAGGVDVVDVFEARDAVDVAGTVLGGRQSHERGLRTGRVCQRAHHDRRRQHGRCDQGAPDPHAGEALIRNGIDGLWQLHRSLPFLVAESCSSRQRNGSL
jgi:hypothetical protein